MTTVVILRLRSEDLASGRIVGRAEIVDRGEVASLHSLDDLHALLAVEPTPPTGDDR